VDQRTPPSWVRQRCVELVALAQGAEANLETPTRRRRCDRAPAASIGRAGRPRRSAVDSSLECVRTVEPTPNC